MQQPKFYHYCFLLFLFLSPTLLKAQWERVPAYGLGSILQLEVTDEGHLFALYHGGWIYRSENHGLSWRQLIFGNDYSVRTQWFARTPANTLVAITNKGIWRSDDEGQSWTKAISGLSGDGTQRTLVVVGDSLYAAQYSRLYHIDIETGQYSQIYSIEPDYKMYLFADGDELWVAPLQGNIRMTPDHGKSWVDYPPEFNSRDICFQNDTVWGVPYSVSYNMVNFVVKGNNTEVFSHTLPEPNIYPIMDATDGRVFMLYPNRIYQFDPASSSWTFFLENSSVQFRTIRFEDGFQYIGTGSGLLQKPSGGLDWKLYNTGIESGYASSFRHIDRYLYAYNSYANGILHPVTPIWASPAFIGASGIGNGPGGFYGKRYPDRLMFSSGNLHDWKEVGHVPGNLAGRIFSVDDSLYVYTADQKIYKTSDLGQSWQLTGTMPSLFKVLVLDSTVYVINQYMKFHRFNPKTGQMEPRSTLPGEFIQSDPPFDAYPPAIFIRSNKLYYSPNEGLTWVLWPEEDVQGTKLLFRDVVACEAGFFASTGYIYFAAEPGDPFTRLPFPPMDTLASPQSNPVNAIEYVDGYLYVAQNDGRLFRRPVTRLSLENYSGLVWRDDNNNGIRDADEEAVSGLMARRGNFRFSITDDSGRYAIQDDLDPDTLFVQSPWPGWTLDPPYRTGTIPADTLDFRLIPPFFRNYQVDMSMFNPVRPGFTTRLRIGWQNLGAVDFATLRFYYPGNMADILSISPAPDAISADTLIWNLTDVKPAQKGHVSIQLRTSTATPIGTVIPLVAEILPIAGDEVPENNRSTITATVVGSFDPNDKQVEPAQYTTVDLSGRSPLVYTIRFQNTGTYPASFVVIRDTLEENLDMGSLQVLSASHPYRLSVLQNRILEFVFDPIVLPDSTSNEPASHGYVKFSILPTETLEPGDTLTNTAYIYFDLNAPIQTNTPVIVLEETLGTISPVEVAPLRITPNPASDGVRVDLPENTTGEGVMYILDINGRIVQTVQTAGQWSLWLSVRQLPAGLYAVHFKSKEIRASGKFVRP